MKKLNSLAYLILTIAIAGCETNSSIPGLPKGPPRYRREVPMAVDPDLQKAARAEVDAALGSNDEMIRANALETLAECRITDSNDKIIAALGDRSAMVRTSAAIAVGRLKITAAADKLQPLLDAADHVSHDEATHAMLERIGAIFACHELGNTKYTHELEKTLYDPRPPVRSETADMMGLIGDRSAIPLLQVAMHTDDSANQRIDEAAALWRLGDEQGRDGLIEATVSGFISDQMLAMIALAEPRDTSVLGHLQGMFSTDNYPPGPAADGQAAVRLVAARCCGQLGCQDGYGVAVEGESSSDSRQRALAAHAFGGIGRHDSQPDLKRLLEDKDPEVRIAAAAALITIGQKP